MAKFVGLGSERAPYRIVALGGGTGLPVVLRGLRRHLPADARMTAIVSAADDGGSSGILRAKYGVIPPGDIRNCLIALARVAPEICAALQYRFDGGSGPGHPVGNLLLTALDMAAADEVAAIDLAARLLGVDDVVLPSTTRNVQLVADLADGHEVRGESHIRLRGVPVARLRVDPPDAAPAPGVLEALRVADAVILGPGSLYTSTLAALLIPGVVEAVAAASARRIFVSNLMTEPGETNGYGVAGHLAALADHGLPPGKLDYVVVNTSPIPAGVQARYVAEGATPVQLDVTASAGYPQIVASDLVEPGPVVRHAADKLGAVLARLVITAANGATNGAGHGAVNGAANGANGANGAANGATNGAAHAPYALANARARWR